MKKVAASVLAREELDRLLAGGVGEGENLISAIVSSCTRLVLQQLLEADQRDFSGRRGRYEPRDDTAGHRGWRNGYEDRELRNPEARSRCGCRRSATQVFRTARRR